MVAIDVDDRPPFEAMAPGWLGFDPAEMLGASAPLLPSGDRRHVALHRCCCGVAGCGVIAARILRSSDGRRISWTDFRNYIGVFDHPLSDADYDPTVGRAWPLAGLVFDADDYEAEVRRLAVDTSWETPRRRAARRVEEHLRAGQILGGAPELALQWVAPAWKSAGVEISFWRTREAGRVEEVLLYLLSSDEDPEAAAVEIVERLAAVAPRDWPSRFGDRT